MRGGDGPPQRAGCKDVQRVPGKEVGLGEQKYYLANPPAHAALKTLAAMSKARWACEEVHQQLNRNSASTTSKAAFGRVFIVTC